MRLVPVDHDPFGQTMSVEDVRGAVTGDNPQMPAHWTPQERQRAMGVNPMLLSAAARAGGDVRPGHLGGTRDQVTQDRLVAQGRSMTRNSNHLSGNAIDLWPGGDPNASAAQYGEMANSMKAAAAQNGNPINWGGDWKSFVDKPHFEMAGGRKPPLVAAREMPMAASAQSRGPQFIPVDHDPFADAATKITVNPIAERSVSIPKPENAQALEAGLEKRATELTTGPATSPSQRMAIEHANVGPAMSQGATPNMDILRKSLISTEVQERDDGAVLFRDPQTGQVVETDNTKHIVMRDPADNTPKVYAKTDAAGESPIVGGARVLAPGLMTGTPTKRAMIPDTSKIQPKASDIFATAKPHYREFDRIARQTPVDDPGAVVARLRSAMESAGVPEKYVDEVLSATKSIFAGTAPKELGGMARVEAEMNRLPIEVAPGKSIAVDALRRAKEQLGPGFKSAENRVRQGTAIATRELEKIIGEMSTEAGQALRRADDIHSTAHSAQDLQRKSNISKMRAGRHRSSAVDRMTTQIRQIVEKAEKGQTTGFKPDELAAMREIVEPGFWRAAVEQTAQLAPGRGFFPKMLAVASASGAPFTGGATLAFPAIGSLANRLNTVLKGRQIERLKELVAKRSPEYAKAVERAVDRYENARLAFENKPTSNTVAGFVAASRALSSGLTRDGIAVSSGDLLKLLSGPVKSAAEDEQRPPGQ